MLYIEHYLLETFNKKIMIQAFISFLLLINGTLITKDQTNMFVINTLPFEKAALEPVMSEKTIELHYGRHQKGYIDQLNKLTEGTPFQYLSIEEVVKSSEGPLFNNAAQAWNHSFYFQQFTTPGSSTPSPDFMEVINKRWGSLDLMKQEIINQGIAQFGSGWVWLVVSKNGELVVLKTPNAYTPIVDEMTPIIGFDVWEHAYYLDYYNKRADHLTRIWEIVNWDVIEKRYRDTL